MPEAQPQSSPLKASLVLPSGARLGGDLSTGKDGLLQLQHVQLLEAPGGTGKVSVKPGMVVQLQLQDTPEDDALPALVCGIANNAIAMKFSDPDSAGAIDCIHALNGIEAPAVPDREPLTGSTAANSIILDKLREQAMDELTALMLPFMRELNSHLLELASHMKPGKDGRKPFYEAAVAVRRNGRQILADMLDVVETYFEQLTPSADEDVFWQRDIKSADDLDLVDLEEFEGHLAIGRIVAAGDSLHKGTLEALLIRIAGLIEAEPLSVRLPVHTRQLSRAFQRALEVQGLEQATLASSYELFTRKVIKKLNKYYVGLNALLLDQGVQPGLEELIKARGTLLKPRSKVHRPKRTEQPRKAAPAPPPGEPQETSGTYLSGAPNPQQSASGAPQPQQGTQGPHQNIYQSVVDALNFRREAEGLVDGRDIASGTPLSGTWDGGTVPSSELDQRSLADAQAIASALGSIQRDSQVQEALQDASSLREYLASNREQLSSLRGTSGLTADSLNQLDLVDNLFGTIKSQLDVSDELKPTLSNLQIPLAKLALLDPQFFLDRKHAARAVVDKLSGLATSANFPNRALEDRISGVVDEIVNDYERDDEVFDRALTKIDKLAAQQERALSRNIERVVKTQEGQEKLLKARRAVNDVINERIRPPAAPRVLLDLVESGWRDLMVLTHVKQGADSPSWSEHIKTLDLLSSWLNEQQQGGVDEDLIMQRGLEAETLIEMIEQQITTALPANIAHQDVLAEMREILASNLAVESTEIKAAQASPGDNPEELRARVEELPRLRRWVRRVEELEMNSWLNFRDKDLQKRRMQLAWVSEARDRYIFVNERGQKIADLNSIQLARKLSRGAQPPAPADQLSVVDQTLYQTLEHVQKTLSFARNHDSLTKLINRETFLDQMARTLRHAQLKNSQHAVIYIDIDQFSLVNDVYDRLSGDQVLLEFSKLLAQMHGKKSSSARIEEDKFAVLILDRSVEQAMELAEKIRADIEVSSLGIDGENVSFTVSIGVTPIAGFSPSVEDILSSARAAVGRAKELGRNRVQQFEQDQALAGNFENDKSKTKENLEQALATDRFLLRAQPIVKSAVGEEPDGSRHYELLLALTNKDGSLSSPEEFIQSAERYGFMTLVDRWVVKEAFSWISELMDAQKEVPSLAINLSGSSVTDDSFMEYLLEQISEFGVGTSKICFEITETGTISNLVKAADFVRAFRNIGCKFSIDDFGTGLASHNYLRELPVDYVKIDGTFITGIHKNRADYAMARSINDLAHFLGQETIAESVENDQIVAKLQEIGVDYLQGWGIGKPKPLAEVTEDLSSIIR